MKEVLKDFIRGKGIEVKDFGAYSEEPSDYPDFAYPVARAVAKGKFDRGIVLCGSGVGVCITANKVKGIRAVLAYDEYTARQSRQHGDCNVLCLAGRKLSNVKAKRITGIWLKTKFSGAARHLRRIHKIEKL
jgi:ribose 5-phosphate isomerase B